MNKNIKIDKQQDVATFVPGASGVPIVVDGTLFLPTPSKGIYVREMTGSGTELDIQKQTGSEHIDFQIIFTAKEYAELELRRSNQRKQNNHCK